MKKTPDISREGFDFDQWRRLAETDPEAFEAARKAAIEGFIDSLGDEQVKTRMRRLQWRVEQERKRSDNPMGACVRIYNMMWRSVSDNYRLISRLLGEEATLTPVREAQVIPFRRATGTEA